MATEAAARARVAHAMPGRIRLRFDQATDLESVAGRLREALAGVEGVLGVDTRPASRSVLILFDPGQVEPRRLMEDGLAVAAVELLEPGGLAPAGPRGDTAVGRSVVRAVGEVNARLGRASRGVLDLRDLFPLTLFGLGLRKVAMGQLQPVPWYNLLYYGYSTFSALHGRRASAAEPDARETLRRRFARGEIGRDEYREIMADLDQPERPARKPRRGGR